MLYSFYVFPANPYGRLLFDTAGNLYGTTVTGNALDDSMSGTVFELDPESNLTELYRFAPLKSGDTDGANPFAGLVADAAGSLYGTTNVGGTEFGSTTVCRSFEGNGRPDYGCGTVFKLDTNGQETVLHSFTGPPDGEYTRADLVMDAAGNLYGTTQGGGTSANCPVTFGCGIVFKIDTAGNETVLHSFTGAPDGATPYSGLILDDAGNLYGTTLQGGTGGCPAPSGIGVALAGPIGCGSVFKIDTTGKETVLYSFAGGTTDGANPVADLLIDADGNLYGTTVLGGTANGGTVFELKAPGSNDRRRHRRDEHHRDHFDHDGFRRFWPFF